MSTKRLGIIEGLWVGLALFVIGLLLQFLVGAIGWRFFEKPFNYLALTIFLSLLLLLNQFRKKNRFIRWLSDTSCATAALLWCGAATALMGLIRQTGDSTWPGFTDMSTQWSFILLYVWLTSSVVMVLYRLALPFSSNKIPFYLSHIGIAMIILSATLGKADQTTNLIVIEKGTERQFANLKITLLDCAMERYEDDSPKSYTAKLQIMGQNGWQDTTILEVNKPYSHKEIKLYLYNFDELDAQYVVLKVVRDPWLNAVISGIVLTLAGAIIRFFKRTT